MASAIGAAVVGGPVDARPWAVLSRSRCVAAESWPSACQLHSSGWQRLGVSEPLHVVLECSQASAVGAAVVVGPFVPPRGAEPSCSQFCGSEKLAEHPCAAIHCGESTAVLRSTGAVLY